MTKEKILMAWSGGKDSAMALHALQASGEFEIAALLTTVTEGYERISMHGVRRALLQAQARTLDLPLYEMHISQGADNGEYERKMRIALEHFQRQGVRRVAFGDLFLEDIRAYREKNLAFVGMEGIFPLWGRPTDLLVREFLSLGFRTYVVCVDTAQLGGEFAGREIDRSFLEELPPNVDPCGERGEFHTFVFAGPDFAAPVGCKVGGRVQRGQFCYADLLPA